jgi:hypothetical protein
MININIATIAPGTNGIEPLDLRPATADELEELEVLCDALVVEDEVMVESIESDVPKILR